MSGTRITLPFSGVKLRTLREKQGMRQQDLSDRTAETGRRRRVYRAHISRYETGDAYPSLTTFTALVDALGCDPDDLCDYPQLGVA